MDCDRFAKCPFVKKYENDAEKKYALKGFVLNYCQGEKQVDCVRKKVSRALGPEKVPINMMPTGHALSGTTKDDWPQEVKNLL